MHRTPTAVLSAVTFVAAFGLSGCAPDAPSPEPDATRALATASAVAPEATPLPAPEALTSVVLALADPSVPPERKVALIQYGTADDRPVLQNFADALAANGYVPLTVQAGDLAWAPQPGDVSATMTLGAAESRLPPFVYPMEFSPGRDGWQLARRSADQLLPLVSSPAPPG